jgi:hypothetical protein
MTGLTSGLEGLAGLVSPWSSMYFATLLQILKALNILTHLLFTKKYIYIIKILKN